MKIFICYISSRITSADGHISLLLILSSTYRSPTVTLKGHAAFAISTVPLRSTEFPILAALVPMMVPVMFIHSDIPKLYTKARERPFHITSLYRKKGHKNCVVFFSVFVLVSLPENAISLRHETFHATCRCVVINCVSY